MQRSIERSSYVPIYVQLQRHMRDMVAEHNDSNRPFYSDNELADIFSVNRLTIRRAVQELVDEGLLYRVRGVGTFIQSPKIEGEPVYQRGFIAQWQLQGKAVQSQILTLEQTLPPARIAKALTSSEDVPRLYVKRLRSADGLPVVLDDIYLPASMTDNVKASDFENQTIAGLLRDKLGWRAKTAAIEIEAAKARRHEAQTLGINVRDPVLLRKITLLSDAGAPLSYGESYHRSDLFKYSLRLPVSEEEGI